MSEMARRFAVDTVWTDEKVETLKAMWAAGATLTEIARDLGVTRSTVSGKKHRLKLPPRREASPPKKRRVPSPHRQPRPNVRKPIIVPERVVSIADADIPFEQRKSLLGLTSKTCRWPVGEPGIDLFFCGAKPDEGCVYCAAHEARAYQKPSARRTPRPFWKVAA